MEGVSPTIIISQRRKLVSSSVHRLVAKRITALYREHRVIARGGNQDGTTTFLKSNACRSIILVVTVITITSIVEKHVRLIVQKKSKKTCVNWPPKSVLAATTPTVGTTTRENEVAGNSTTVAAAATATTSKLNNNASKDVTEDLRHASPNHLKQSKNRSRQKCASYRAKPETAEQQNCGTTTTELTACARASLMVDAAGTRTISHRSNSVGKIVETRKMRALFLRSSDLATPSTNSSITTHVLILACRSSMEVARVTTTDSRIRRPANKGANEWYPPKKYPFKRRHLQVSTVERFAVLTTMTSFSRNAPHERRDVLRTSRSRKLHGQPFRFLLQSDQSSVHSVHVHRLWREWQSFQQRRAVREAVWQIQRTRYFVVIGTVAVLIVWGADVCNMPREEGPCKGYFVKYYYEKSVGRCAQFAYGGCGGTGNRFSSNEECESICVTHEEKRSNVTSTAVCELPVDTGSCQDGYHKRWYFDNARGECIAFLFSGCGGNLNNFKTFQSCVDFCKDYLTVTQPPVGPQDHPCQAHFDECATLRCPYGIEAYVDDNQCNRCQCQNPCSKVDCPPNSQCAIDINRNRTTSEDPDFIAVCRESKNETVPPPGRSDPVDFSQQRRGMSDAGTPRGDQLRTGVQERRRLFFAA
jgi:hypothetical protein